MTMGCKDRMRRPFSRGRGVLPACNVVSARAARALRRSALVFLLLAGTAGNVRSSPVSAQLRELSRKLASANTAQNRTALGAFAGRAGDTEKGLALLALGMAEYANKDYAAAARTFASAMGRAGAIDDYAAYYRARSLVLAEEFEAALEPLRSFIAAYPDNRLRKPAGRLIAESLIRLGRFAEARSALSGGLPQAPEGKGYLLARIEHIEGNLLQAVKLYRAVYYSFPTSDAAEASEKQLDAIRRSLGSRYPKAPAKQRLGRADLLYAAGEYTRASAEYGRAAGAGLSGAERERALVRKAAADYHRRWAETAYNSLVRLRTSEPAIDAERLYYLGAAARRNGAISRFLAAVNDLGAEYPASPWLEEALFAAGNHYLLRNEPEKYREYYGRLVRSFPQGKHAAAAHWKIVWRACLDDDPRRRQLLEEHIDRYPASATAVSAMYWLGRTAEQEGRADYARGLYDLIAKRYPHYYYAVMARRRIADMGNLPPPERASRLAEIAERLPAVRRLAAGPSAETELLLERGSLLYAVGLDALAAQELFTADYRAPDAHLVGLEIGRQSSERGDHFRAMRAMKRYGYGYLRFPLQAVDRKFWEYLYPLGWEKSLRARAARHKLDPYLVAALIRQESEFNPSARSHAGALGLMQIMPGTGKQLFRRLGIPNYSSRKLTQPDISLRLGTFHLKNVLDSFQGNLEYALAGYNAGERRIDDWRLLGKFDDPGEFAETIPFSETRGYVQSVIRNRDMYRRLYDAARVK